MWGVMEEGLALDQGDRSSMGGEKLYPPPPPPSEPIFDRDQDHQRGCVRV